MSPGSRVLNSFVAVTLLGAGVALAQAPPPGSGPITLTGFVRVIDGDTIETRLANGHLVGIGLIGIRAARGNSPCGRDAIALLRSLTRVPGLRLEEDTAVVLDGRKRRMYHLVTPDGRSVARELTKAGLAKTNGKGKEKDDLAVDEDEAKRGNRGCINDFPVDKDRAKDEEFATPVVFFPRSSALADADPAPEARRPLVEAKTPTAAEPRAIMPSGFAQEVVAAGFTEPTGFAFLPDGRILVAEKAGKVYIVKNGAVLPTPFIDLSSRVNTYWDRGLVGIVADPNFAANQFVYLLYTYENDPENYSGRKTQQLLRVKAIGDIASTASTDQRAILGTNVGESCDLFPVDSDCIPSDEVNHAVGSLRFASDGALFVTIGDDASFNVVSERALRSQDTRALNGKILRVDPVTGAGFTTNPFYPETANVNANSSKVWALGFRNPFRLGLRPADNLPFVGDVGWNSWEEINVALPGGNFGWPCYEGVGRQPGYELLGGCQTIYNRGTQVRPPLYTYDHSVGASVTGGAFYGGVAYPEPYRGAYFFGDYVAGWIRYLTVDANLNLAPGMPASFATAAGGPVDIQAGPNTNLYYLDINNAQLLQIRYTGANTPPRPRHRGARRAASRRSRSSSPAPLPSIRMATLCSSRGTSATGRLPPPPPIRSTRTRPAGPTRRS